MADRRRCGPRGRRAEFCARALRLLEQYPDQEFSGRQIALEAGESGPDVIVFLSLLAVTGKVRCVCRGPTLYYRKG